VVDEGDLLWTPGAERIDSSRLHDFQHWLEAQRGLRFASYQDLHEWSIDDLNGFWSALAEWAGVRWLTPPDCAVGDRTMPGTDWFPGSQLNYAAHLLYPLTRVDTEATAVVAVREDGREIRLTWRQLRTQVASVRAWLVTQGVGRGDRVAALLPNGVEALIAVLATASLGAVWSSCSPDFGATAIADRFTQIEPTVLFTVDGYVYGGKPYDIGATVAELRAKLPSLSATVLVGYLADDVDADAVTPWTELLAIEAT